MFAAGSGKASSEKPWRRVRSGATGDYSIKN
jgi:hypothetical protein